MSRPFSSLRATVADAVLEGEGIRAERDANVQGDEIALAGARRFLKGRWQTNEKRLLHALANEGDILDLAEEVQDIAPLVSAAQTLGYRRMLTVGSDGHVQLTTRGFAAAERFLQDRGA